MSIVPESHQFVRPGQVSPEYPPPDNCMVCGQPEAEHARPCTDHLVIGCEVCPSAPSGYADEAAQHDQFLHDALAKIRAATDAGEMTVRQAAEARIDALQHHIDATAALRAEYFGDSR